MTTVRLLLLAAVNAATWSAYGGCEIRSVGVQLQVFEWTGFCEIGSYATVTCQDEFGGPGYAYVALHHSLNEDTNVVGTEYSADFGGGLESYLGWTSSGPRRGYYSDALGYIEDVDTGYVLLEDSAHDSGSCEADMGPVVKLDRIDSNGIRSVSRRRNAPLRTVRLMACELTTRALYDRQRKNHAKLRYLSG